jgi:GTP-binding protein YchF
MSLKCGIVGLAGTGKTTIFNCMSNVRAATSRSAFSSSKANLCVIPVPDDRLHAINKIVLADKVTPATVEIIDIPGLGKGAVPGEGTGSKFLAEVQQCDALIHVLRCFDDESLPHIEGSVDPVRDIEILELELQAKDLDSVNKKMQRLEKVAVAGDAEAKRAVEAIQVYKKYLESFQPVRSAPVETDDNKYIAELFLLSDKPVIYVCNVDDASAAAGNTYVEQVREALREQQAEVLVIAGALEAEIAELENPADRQDFLADAGLTEPGVNKLIRAAYRMLDLQSFFTASNKEVRAWTIHRGMTAQQAAGIIHSDMERGFIRAEVLRSEDFIELGSEHACKEAGRFKVEGKSYVVQEGDILHIRFNV